LAEAPLLRRDRKRQVSLRELALGQKRNFHRRRIADRFGQQADHVVKVSYRTQSAVPPGRVRRTRSHRRARFVLGYKTAVHRGPHKVDSKWNQRIEIVVERIAKRRREKHGAYGSGLMMIVNDLRKPVVKEDSVDGFGL